jgi:hypothetical protein
MNRIAALIGLLVLGFLTACGGGNGGGQQQTITVTVGPKTASVAGGQTQTIVATILNPNNTGVNWTLSGTGCTGAACGTLSNPGGNNNQGWTIDYTAPLAIPSPATVTITATSRDDPTKSDSSTITVTAAVVSVGVAPATPTVILGATQQFNATVKGSTNTAVTWSVTGRGTISASGLYTAPDTLAPVTTTPATVTVTAISQADNTKSGSATITIPAVTVSAAPKVSSVILGASQQFTATVTNATNTSVTWNLSGPGSLSSSGLYTAPATLNTPSTATVQAVSQADPYKTMSITFSIPAVTVGISPQSPTVMLGATQQFTAAVGSATNTAVTWSMTGVGTVSNTGLYTAPSTLTTPSSATVIATSVADPSKSASTTITIPAVGVTVAPPTVPLQGGASQTFTATVTKATNTSVTWSLSGLGTLGTNGAYTAPTVVPSQQTATITATSVADQSKSGSAIVTLIPVSVTVSPSPVSVPLNTTQQFTATVGGTSNSLVTWNVSGTGCSGDDCGKISSSGLYTAPSAIPNPATVTVTATSAADMTKFGTAVVTITDNANAKLNGSFAFMFQGFYLGNMIGRIGSFTADGQGHLTNGLSDVNQTNGALSTKQSFTGTYQLHGDNRGTMTFDTLPGSPSFRFAINDNGDKGRLVEIDSTGVYGGGLFRKQTTTDFIPSKIPGNFAFGFYGNGVTGERNAAVGCLQLNSNGTISNGVMDTNSPGSTTLSGTFTFDSTTGSTNGRGTMSIVVAGQTGTFSAGFYLVNADQIFFLLENQTSLDYPLLLGEVRRQWLPFSAASLSGAAVFYSNGLSSTSGTTKALIGQFVVNGTSTLSGEMAISDGGNPTPLATFAGASYSVASNGRGQFTTTPTGQAIFYLIRQDSAFLLLPASGGLGMIDMQTIAGNLKTSDMVGRYLVSNAQTPVPNGGDFSGSVIIDGAGGWTGTADLSASSPSTDLYNAGTVAVASPATGRVIMTVTVPTTYNQIIYAQTPDRLLVLDVDPSYYNSGTPYQATGFWEK